MNVILFRTLTLATFLAVSCDAPKTDTGSTEDLLPIEGTWKLLSETKIQKTDTTYSEASKDLPMIKIINKTHFSFLRHDLHQGKDSSALFVAGGGRYTLKDSTYTEYLEYCNSREWENNTFHFTVDVANDTLVQKGTERIEELGIDRIIIEKYSRVKE
jgi:hypothetical protein